MKHDENIVRKADQSSCLVVMEKTEYQQKLDAILSSGNKFKALTRNPTAGLKTSVNKPISK